MSGVSFTDQMTRKYESIPIERRFDSYAPKKGFGFIYKITRIKTGKSYVGLCKTKFRKRIADHLSNGSGCLHIHSALNKYGRHAFKYEIIEFDVPIEDLRFREKACIAFHDTYRNGYNLTEGGDVNPMDCPEVKKKHKATMSSDKFIKKAKIARTKTFATQEYKDRVGKSHAKAWEAVVDREKHRLSITESWTNDRKDEAAERMYLLHQDEDHKKKQIEGMQDAFKIKHNPLLSPIEKKTKLLELRRKKNRESARIYREKKRSKRTEGC